MKIYLLVSILFTSLVLGTSANARPYYGERTATKKSLKKLKKKRKKARKKRLKRRHPHMARKKFSAFFLASAMRTTYPYDVVYSSYSVDLGYQLSRKSELTGSLSFSHAFEDYKDQYTTQFEDVSVAINRSLYARPSGFRVVGQLKQDFPTSITSREASMLSRTSGGITLIAMGPGRTAFTWANMLAYSYHRYDTADEAGKIKNSPVAYTTAISMSVPFLKRFSFRLAGGRYTLWDYDSRQDALTFAAAKLRTQLTSQFAISLFGKVKSKVLTNNSLFDHDNANYGVNISIGI